MDMTASNLLGIAKNGNYLWGTTTATTTAGMNFYYDQPVHSIEPPRPPTNLDWLDKRVEEMRVRL